MLLNIYLGTVIVDFVVTKTFVNATYNKMKREGHRFQDDESFAEKLLRFMSMLFYCAIPVLNVICVIGILGFKDMTYEFVKEKLLKKKAYMPEEKEASMDSDTKSQFSNSNQNVADNVKNDSVKKYANMTDQEKVAYVAYLEREYERLCNQKSDTNIESLSENVEEQESVLVKTIGSKN